MISACFWRLSLSLSVILYVWNSGKVDSKFNTEVILSWAIYIRLIDSTRLKPPYNRIPNPISQRGGIWSFLLPHVTTERLRDRFQFNHMLLSNRLSVVNSTASESSMLWITIGDIGPRLVLKDWTFEIIIYTSCTVHTEVDLSWLPCKRQQISGRWQVYIRSEKRQAANISWCSREKGICYPRRIFIALKYVTWAHRDVFNIISFLYTQLWNSFKLVEEYIMYCV